MAATILIGGIVFGLMALVVVKQFKKFKNGETGCGCGCSRCSKASECHSVKIEKK